jgi:hypothetical protein
MKHRTLTIFLLLAAACVAVVCPRLVPSAAGEGATTEPQRSGSRRRPNAGARGPRVDYSKFSHSTAAHRKDSCDSCHKTPSGNWAQVRDAGAAFPDITDYPEHASCVGCHRTQFFSGARPIICSVCHNVVSPRAGNRHPFENPGEPFARSEKGKTRRSEFALNFPHDVHQDVMARLSPSPAGVRGVRFVRAVFAQESVKPTPKPNSCSICHETFKPPAGRAAAVGGVKPADAATSGATPTTLPDGLLKTTPTGHDSCFNCHWQDGGEKPFSSDCAGCHKLLPPQGKTPGALPVAKDADLQLATKAGFTDSFIVKKLLRRETVTFAHDEENHKAIDCTSCHVRIPAINTLDDETLKVPILSCGGGSSCHVSARPKKILNEEVDKRAADAGFQCTKCHVNFGKEKIPKSHLDAVGK